MSSSFNEVTQQIATSIVEHGPEIKIGFGITTGLAALILAIYGSSKATKELSNMKPDATKIEKAKVIAKNVGPAVVAEAASIFLTVKGVKGIEDAKNDALETAAAAVTSATLAKEALKLKNDAIKEKCDEKTQKQIKDSVGQKRLDNSQIQDHQVTMSKQPQQLFHENISDRYFMSSMQDVEDAMKSIRKKMSFDEGHRHNDIGFIGVNEIFWELQLPTLDSFDKLGYREDIDGPLYPDMTPGFATDGRTCVNIEFEVPDTSYWELAKYKINTRRFP